MALAEQSVLKSVEIDHESNTAQVLWVDRILKDGVVVSETPKRKAYGSSQVAEFLDEVGGADNYLAVLGWSNV